MGLLTCIKSVAFESCMILFRHFIYSSILFSPVELDVLSVNVLGALRIYFGWKFLGVDWGCHDLHLRGLVREYGHGV
jgi:hypothetical protein